MLALTIRTSMYSVNFVDISSLGQSIELISIGIKTAICSNVHIAIHQSNIGQKQKKSIFKFVSKELGYTDALFSYHNIIRPYELDIYVPCKKVAIEFNGIRWHSIENETTIDYHLYKTQQCEDAGVKLIHIWEDEWKNNEPSIK